MNIQLDKQALMPVRAHQPEAGGVTVFMDMEAG